MLSRFALQMQVCLVLILVLVHMTMIGAVSDMTIHALTRLRNYLRSAGRYGSSPFLVGHYGGLGEIAQGFCRVSAVSGGVYILDRKIEEIATPTSASGDKFVVNLDDLPEPLTADVLFAAHDQLPLSLHPLPAQDTHISFIARCIAVIDKPITFPPLLSSDEGLSEDEVESAIVTSGNEDAGGQSSESATQPELPAEASLVDTSIIIFPPCSVNGGSSTTAAQAFTTGAGTLSAPQGKCKEDFFRVGCSRLNCHIQTSSISRYQSRMAKTPSHRLILTSRRFSPWQMFLNRCSRLSMFSVSPLYSQRRLLSIIHPFSSRQLCHRTQQRYPTLQALQQNHSSSVSLIT